MSFGVCTIFSKNYLPFVRNFTDTFLKHNPNAKVFVLMVDELNDAFDPRAEKFELFDLHDLDIPNLEAFTFKYNVTELNTAAKPYFLEFLYNKYPELERLCYIDPDISFYDELNEIDDLLKTNNFVVTPHAMTPMPNDGHWPSDVAYLRSGTYNLGFIGTRRDPEVFKMLKWWQEKLYNECVSLTEEGYFTDQKWMILLNNFFNGTYVLKEPGYNVAYWNLHERSQISKEDNKYFVNNKPLYFFHYSGLPLDNIEQVSKHQDRWQLSKLNNPVINELFAGYRDRVLSYDFAEVIKWPYAYGQFDNGVKITDFMRRNYWERKDLQTKFPNPYLTAGDSYLNWLISDARKQSLVPNWLEYLYHQRADLKSAFPNLWERDQLKLINWALAEATNLRLDPFFTENLKTRITNLKTPASEVAFRSRIAQVLEKRLPQTAFNFIARNYQRLHKQIQAKEEDKLSQSFANQQKQEQSK